MGSRSEYIEGEWTGPESILTAFDHKANFCSEDRTTIEFIQTVEKHIARTSGRSNPTPFAGHLINTDITSDNRC